jgi:hypothetical protein
MPKGRFDMTVSLSKEPRFPVIEGFEPMTDLLVVLRRYDISTAPWGVHVVTVDLRRDPIISSRAIGLFSTEQVFDVTLHFDFPMVHMDLGPVDVDCVNALEGQVLCLLHDYIWTQLVPMEWHDKAPSLHWRMLTLLPDPMCMYFSTFEDSLEDLRFALLHIEAECTPAVVS